MHLVYIIVTCGQAYQMLLNSLKLQRLSGIYFACWRRVSRSKIAELSEMSKIYENHVVQAIMCHWFQESLVIDDQQVFQIFFKSEGV